MHDYKCDVAVIGAGPAGLAAAVAAREAGAQDVLIIERDFRPGGILEQCIHTGFGLRYFSEEMAGPEYAHRFIAKAEELGVQMLLNTMVLSIEAESRTIHAVNPQDGAIVIQAGAIVLAMGCRERTRGAIVIPGTRPAGVYTAGTAQRFLNVQNYLVGKKIVILGSGDIGMIMARRMTMENAEVKAVVEIMPYLAGLRRNRVQCLDDFGIPLYLSHTITEIKGRRRVEAVTVAKVGPDKKPIPGTEFDIECDTLLLSVGLIPENELSKNCGVELDPISAGPIVDDKMQTNCPGIFACGNVVHVNDLVDNVSTESALAGQAAAAFARGDRVQENVRIIQINHGTGVRYTVPQKIVLDGTSHKSTVYFRVTQPNQRVSIKAEAGNSCIAVRKRPFVNPGEMEHIELDIAALESLDTEAITINVGKED